MTAELIWGVHRAPRTKLAHRWRDHRSQQRWGINHECSLYGKLQIYRLSPVLTLPIGKWYKNEYSVQVCNLAHKCQTVLVGLSQLLQKVSFSKSQGAGCFSNVHAHTIQLRCYYRFLVQLILSTSKTLILISLDCGKNPVNLSESWDAPYIFSVPFVRKNVRNSSEENFDLWLYKTSLSNLLCVVDFQLW